MCRAKHCTRCLLHGNIANKRLTPYSNGDGQRLTFDFEDASGTIRCVAFNAVAKEKNEQLVEGNTYKITNAMPKLNDHSGSLEVKIWNDTDFQFAEPMTIHRPIVTIEAAKLTNGVVRIGGILCQLDEETRDMRDGGKMRRCQLMDADKNEIQAYLTNDAAKKAFQNGTPVLATGNISSNGAMFITNVEDASSEASEKLSTLWNEADHPSKRQCIPVSTILSIKDAAPGDKVDLTAIVRSCGTGCISVGKDRVKYTMSIVDKSMAAIDLAVFASKDDVNIKAKIGDTVAIRGTVSGYNGRSITTNTFQKTSDDDLVEWWNTNKNATITEITTYAAPSSQSILPEGATRS